MVTKKQLKENKKMVIKIFRIGANAIHDFCFEEDQCRPGKHPRQRTVHEYVVNGSIYIFGSLW